MDDPVIVRLLDHPGKRRGQADRLDRRHRLARKTVGETASFDQLQAKVGNTQVFANVVDRDDLGIEVDP
jgi:hypothetical protein